MELGPLTPFRGAGVRHARATKTPPAALVSQGLDADAFLTHSYALDLLHPGARRALK